MNEISPEARQQARLDKLRAEMTETARKDLRRWARVYAQRDQLVREAHDRGVGVNEIARLTDLAKTTVIRILAGES